MGRRARRFVQLLLLVARIGFVGLEYSSGPAAANETAVRISLHTT